MGLGEPSRLRPRQGRITGIDAARGVAMAGMVTVHFVNWREGDGPLYTAAGLLSGRAMPLFMLLGGLGVTLLVRRAATPTRNLLIRAVLLFGLGLVLTEYIDRLAIVLQAYGLFFVLAIVLWRLPSSVLLALVPLIGAVGAVTYQTIGEPRVQTTYESLSSWAGPESLLFDGFYPLFPMGAFFVLGIVLGRLDLRSDRAAGWLLAVGSIVGFGTWIGASQVVSRFDVQIDFGGRRGDGSFHWGRLLDVEGHSAMPAWVISALGTSVAVLGLCLLVARRWEAVVRPLIVVGSMSLTFYVYQAWVTNLVPPTADTGVVEEWLYAFGVYTSFLAAAALWKLKFKRGPLERLLRVGSR